jgi:hypothetical protein
MVTRGFDPRLSHSIFEVTMTPAQIKYLEEYERYKDIQIIEGREYLVLNRPSTTYQVVQVDYTDEKVSLRNKSGLFLTKTLHWCRKNLSMLGDKT